MQRFYLFILGLILVLGAEFAAAQDFTRTLKTDTKEHLDAVLVLDASGSMLLTDPLRLRDEGAKLFAQFLREGDRLAILQFAGGVKVLRPLSPFDSSQIDQITRTIKGVPTTGTFTDLLAPIKAAGSLLKQNVRRDADQAIIVLSDGKMDPDPKVGSAALLTNELFSTYLPELKNENVRVHTLSLSDQSDKELLGQMAETTNGAHWFTPTADDIHQSFAELFLVVKKPQIVPLTSKGFRIDDEVSEATFYINREEDKDVELIPPEGESITRDTDLPWVKWFAGKKFEVVTIEDPTPGQWQVLGLPKNEGFATLLTNLKLLSNWPLTVKAGIPTTLEAQLFESKRPVVLPRIKDVVRFRFQITPTDKVSEPILNEELIDDGTSGDKLASDGIYSRDVLIDQPGEYRLMLIATSPTFERSQQLLFRVKPRLLNLEVVKREDSILGSRSQPSLDPNAPEAQSDYLRVTVGQELLGARKLEVELIAADKEGNRFKLPLTKIDDVYEVSTANLPTDGQWELRALFVAETKKKRRIKGDSQVVEYLKLKDQTGDEPVIQVVVEDKKPEPKVEAKPMHWFIALLIVTVFNLAGGGGAFFTLSKEKGTAPNPNEQDLFTPHEPIEGMIAALEAKVDKTEVDLEDPIFTDDSIQLQVMEREERPAPAKEEEAAEAPPPPADPIDDPVEEEEGFPDEEGEDLEDE